MSPPCFGEVAERLSAHVRVRWVPVLKVPAGFLKLGYYDPITQCFRSHPH